MKKVSHWIVAAIIVVFLASCSAEEVDFAIIQERNGIAYLPNETEPFSGKATSYYENGQLELEANYKNGELHGLVRNWYENGQLKFEANYENGELHGLVRNWYENGQLEFEANYKNGELKK